jgi:hypothetical protein
MSISTEQLLVGTLAAGWVGLGLYLFIFNLRMGSEALHQGRAKGIFGIPTNAEIAAELKRRRQAGDRLALFNQKLGWAWIAPLVLLLVAPFLT